MYKKLEVKNIDFYRFDYMCLKYLYCILIFICEVM